MRVTVLGGSAAGANTGQGCSGYLVSTEATTLVLDLGPGTLIELRRHTDFRRLTGIVISHLHADHALDLVALRFALAYNPTAPPGRVPLWMPPGGLRFLERVARAFAEDGADRTFFSSVFDIAEYDPSRDLTIGDATLLFTPTVHYVDCWAMRLSSAGGGVLAYTGDTGPAADLNEFLKGARVLIAEGTLLESTDEPFDQRGHLTAAEAAELAARAGVETLVLTHLWEENDIDRYQALAASRFSRTIVVAKPGVTVEW